MKKSEMIKKAMVAVIKDAEIDPGEKLEIIRKFLDEECVALLVERRDEEESEAVQNG